MDIRVHDAIADIGAAEWNRLAGDRHPFLRHEFLFAAETSGSVCEDTGWRPCHLTLNDGDKLRGALPLYQKNHSWGEFVFDWAWAHAFERVGISYYPKLVSASPFTPATCPKLLTAADDRDAQQALIDAALELAKERQCSSLHLQFVTKEEGDALRDADLALRRDCQFHWRNRGYKSFDDFLHEFSSRKRKKARRERRRVAEAGIRFRWLDGHALTDEDWVLAYRLISRTFMQRGSLPYFTLEFFQELGRTLPDQLRVVFADDAAGAAAAAVFFVGTDTLYGRYWGCQAHYNALHFETCYYQGIDFCIEHGLSSFEPGTQGEHKISRGFTPVSTWSAHWLAKAEFRRAINAWIDEESRHVEQYMRTVDLHSPFRRDDESNAR